VLFLAAWWPARLDRRGPARLALIGAGLLGLATLTELYLQAPYATGAGVFSVRGADLLDVLSSRVGLALLARLGLLVLAAPLLVLVGRGSAASTTPLAVLAVFGVATWPISGHTGASRFPSLTIFTDSVHLGAVAFWLGGLIVLLGYLLRRANGEELAGILPAWSRWAFVAVAALATAGLIQAVVEVPSIAALTGTRYGLLLLAKVGVFALILAAAFLARRSVRRRTPDGPPRSRLRRTVATELGLAAVVLGLTAVLVQTAPAGTALAQTGPGYEVTVGMPVCSVRLHVIPARVGVNTLQLAAFDPDGTQVQVLSWLVTATLRDNRTMPITASLRAVAADQAAGTVNLPRSGRWRLHIAVRVSGGDPESASVNTTMTVP
jgi:copper transport protein